MASIRKKNHRSKAIWDKSVRKYNRENVRFHAYILQHDPQMRKTRWRNINKACGYTRWERWV